jgi:oxygen-independent coproporphyrinogen III oxidase
MEGSTPIWHAVPDRADDCGVYVHFPYCVQKCPYCDFNSHPQKLGTRNDDYTEAVLHEIETRVPLLNGRRLRSIFFGGGTPSMWDARSIERVVARIRSFFPGHEALEITLEANPGTLERGRLDEFKGAGINRCSMGIQALDTPLLRTLGRVHDADEALAALDLIQETGFASHSIDFMFGIPGQSKEAWQRSLQKLIALGTPHVSAYNLIYEPGTRLHALKQKGAVTPVDEDEEAAMFELTSAHFQAAGFRHYEVSNYAKPGHESVHNQLYWRGIPYVGVGAGAHSFVPLADDRARRTENVRAPAEYVASWKDHTTNGAFSLDETVDAVQQRDERVMLGLRTARGWRTESGHERHAAQAVAKSHPRHCVYEEPYLKPTEHGYLMNDALILACVQMLDSMLSMAPMYGGQGFQ